MRGGEYSLADIKAVTEGNNNDGFGGNTGAWWIIIIIILFGGWGNRGFGGFGGNGSNGGTSVYEGYVLNNDFSQLSRQIADSTAMTERKLDNVNNGLCSLGYQELQNITGVNNNISNGVYNLTNAITTSGYETRNAITQDTIANMQNTNTLNASIKDCCCTTQRSIDGVNFNIQGVNNAIGMQTNAIQSAMTMNTRDIIDNQNANFRALHDEIVANRIEDKNAQIQAQQNEINALRLAASQTAQNDYLVNKLRPCPIPAYPSCNPWGCNCNSGCGCNM